jgi:hypothetical protein
VKRAAEKYKDKGLVVLWIGHQDKVRKLTAYAKRLGMDDYLYDRTDEVSRKYGMTYGGGIVFINRGGIVKKRIPKGFTIEQLQKNIEAIL